MHVGHSKSVVCCFSTNEETFIFDTILREVIWMDTTEIGFFSFDSMIVFFL